MNTNTRALVLHNYNAFSSLVDGMSINGISLFEKFLKYACANTTGTLTCDIASTLLRNLRIYGAELRCSDRQKWAIAFGTAEKGIRIRTIEQRTTDSNSSNKSEAHETADKVSNPVARYHIANNDTYNLHLSLPLGDRYASNVSDPTGIDIYDTVKFRKADSEEETMSATIVKKDGDMRKGRISIEAPVGKAFLGHHEKDIVKVGKNTFEILSIRERGTVHNEIH